MEPNESTGLSSYYHHQTVHPSSSATTNAAAAAAAASNVVPTNGISPNAGNSSAATAAGGAASHMVYPGSMPSAVSSPMETVRRKRGRPRKYGTPEQAAAAKRMSSAASASNSQPKKRDQVALGGGGGQGGGGSSYSSKKSQFAGIGDAGQGFTPHVINVLAGEDVSNKIMTFMQQSKREICILSASGAVSSASLLQPSTSGGSVTYEGRFEILSLSGSYVNNGRGGKTGGLSVCLASNDGQIIGGGIGGPLTAAGQIQVIVGTFVVDTKKDTGGVRHDTPAQVGMSPMPGVGFQSHQSIGGSQFMTQPRGGMQPTPLQWRSDAGQGVHQSPENGGFDHLGE